MIFDDLSHQHIFVFLVSTPQVSYHLLDDLLPETPLQKPLAASDRSDRC